jgi:hypothetical protein
MPRVLLGLAVVAVAVIAAPRTALADCAATPVVGGAMDLADTVFVGTVVELDNNGKYATFAVEEVWKGPIGDEVEVRGGPADQPGAGESVSSSAERRYDLGTRYLVTAYQGDTHAGDPAESPALRAAAYSDNICSGTGVWTDDLARLRPTTATIIERDEPIQPRTNADSSPPYVMIALTTVLVAGGCLYLLFRRGSIAYRARQDGDSSSQP